MTISFDNTYIKRGGDFYVKTKPSQVPEPKLILFNHELADELGLSHSILNTDEAVAYFSGNKILKGSEPLAMVYAGHQFGSFSPQLGDGRALHLGEIVSPKGVRYDLQLKGSGRTYFSRGGDGKSALGPVLREYLVSEAMAKLGIPTTRALAAVTTGEEVARMQLVAGGILTRVATSFVRVGTFEYFAARKNEVAVKKLADYVIARNYPELLDHKNPYTSFLKAVINRQAYLIAQWMQLGFIHGVMNTDNVSIVGETLDYGPCAFMDDFSHKRCYSSVDRNHRYAYTNQPAIGQWNLVRLAESLLLLLGDENTSPEKAVEIAQNALNAYIDIYRGYWLAGMREKIGLQQEQADDKALIENLLDIMETNKADFTLTFRYLSQLNKTQSEQDKRLKDLFKNEDDIAQWLDKWRDRLNAETQSDDQRQAKMQVKNPAVIPRNHQIEAAIRSAEDHNDFSVFYKLHNVLQTPYDLKDENYTYSLPPEPEELVLQTFCGT